MRPPKDYAEPKISPPPRRPLSSMQRILFALLVINPVVAIALGIIVLWRLS